MWHSLILQKWKPLFAWLPIETLIHEHQDEYYRVLNQTNTDGESTVFIEFMLRMIRDTLYEVVQNQGENVGQNVGQNVGVKLAELKTDDKILILLKDNPQMTAQGIADILGKSRRQIERIIAKLKEDGKLERIGASKSGYWVVKGVNL